MTHNALLCVATSMLVVAIESIMLGVVMLNAVELHLKIKPILSFATKPVQSVCSNYIFPVQKWNGNYPVSDEL